MKDVVENALKNRVFFGTSIWKGFGRGFGRVWEVFLEDFGRTCWDMFGRFLRGF